SAFAYAARRAGISNEALAAGLRKMQSREFRQMYGAGKVGGMNLGSGDALDQLKNFMRATEGMSAVERVGRARAMGLTELIPLIAQGSAFLDHFTDRAKELGLVMSEQDAKAGKQFTLALGDLHEVIMGSVKAIGGALVPMLTGLANVITNIAITVRDWIKRHQQLTQAIFIGTGAIVAIGIAIK